MKDYRFLIEETIRNMDSKISSYWLMEGIAEIAKQFPKVPEEKLRELIALDPTYKGGEQLGKYGQWIIRLFYNNIKNIERMKQYKEFLKQNPDGINPKTGQPIAKPELLPDVSRAEDYEKIPNLLKQYDLYKNKIKKPITDFKTIPELYQTIEEFTKQDVPADKRALERYYVFKDCEKKGLKKIYEDSKWMIGIPTTLESSVPFGNFTNWCTTSAHGQYYRHYLERYGGQYFILLNKQNGDLYQFHFESEQFMDEKDHKIDMYNFTKDNRKIAEFLNEYKQKLLNKIATGDEDRENDDKEYIKLKELLERFNAISSDPQQVTRNILYDNYTKDVSISGDKITGQFDLSSLGNIVYSSSDFSLETACGLLTDFFFHFEMGDMGDIDDNDEAYRWNPIARESNIPDFDWDRLCRIYKDEEFDDEDDEEDEYEDTPKYVDNGILYCLSNIGYADKIWEVRKKLVDDDITDENGKILDYPKLKAMLPSYWDEKIDNNKKQAIREIIKENFYDGEDLLQFIYRCIESGTENECYEDLMGQLKQELPVTGPIYEGVKSTDVDFEISKDDLWKIFYVQQTHNGNNIPSLEEAMNIKPKEPEPEQLSFLSEPMKEDWFQKYSRYGEDEDENRYYDGEDENWLYIWRVIKGKCDMDDGSYGAFSFEEPYNGWYDFDDKYFEGGSKHAAERIAKILGRDNEVK